jgi:hypothetical protein
MKMLTPAGLLLGLLLPGPGPAAERSLGDFGHDAPVEERFAESRPAGVEQGSDPLLTEVDRIRPEADQHKGLDRDRREPIGAD